MEYRTPNKVFIKSHNKSTLLISRYGYVLIAFLLLTLGIYLFMGNTDLAISLGKSVGISLVSSIIFGYIINIIKKDYDFKKLFISDYVHIIGIAIGLFGVNVNYLVVILAVLISLLIKLLFKGVKISAPLYGILVIILYKYYIGDLATPLMEIYASGYTLEFGDKILDYVVGIAYLSPLLSALSFIYLFWKKSIKYNIIFSFMITFSLIMFSYGVFSGNMWFLIIHILLGNTLFLVTFMLSDYEVTPTLDQTQIVYGIILGMLAAGLRFIAPELALVIPFIIGPIILSRPLDAISPKLKYNGKLFYSLLGISFVIALGLAYALSCIY